ncbi:hypothetical protein PV10_07083 [Exophiala mesophila]|uniref:Cytochrome c oxidase assembly protein COX20, mitochondrial n=1 Tax=Exophiala mesophila TaxID=212818 RepID=A0A0D1Z4J0_EXOME|nr:uncharacterized protein PV10_07083 [Exophiala mesophila]KIV89702.1 hypothetical protein PV10_07083 [Exophiala mesophila]
MADDTRDTKAPPATADPSSPPAPDAEEPRRPRRPKPKYDFPQTQVGKLWDAFGNPDEPINTVPGGTYNSAGGKPKEVTWRDAFNFSYGPGGPAWYQTQCSRDSLLVGIGAGGAVGGSRFILKGISTIGRSANYAVATFVLTSGVMYYWCDQKRREESRGMAIAVAGMKLLHEKKAREKAEAAAAQEAARKAEEEARRRSWYKFW